MITPVERLPFHDVYETPEFLGFSSGGFASGSGGNGSGGTISDISATATTTPDHDGTHDGTATVYPVGGVGAVTTTWYPETGAPVVGNPITGRTGGEHIGYVVRDTVGNTATGTVLIGIVGTPVPPPDPPTVIGPDDASVTIGDPVEFSVAVGGTAPFTYQWFFNDVEILGAVDATYSIAAAVSGDAGLYSVQVSNAAGSTGSREATLTVNAPALVASYITTDESVVALTPQGDGSFTVTISGGVGPYTIQSYGYDVGPVGATSPVDYTGLAGATDYEVHVWDSLLTEVVLYIHVYRAAATGTIAYNRTQATLATNWTWDSATPFPRSPLTFPQCDPASFTLSSVDWALDYTCRSSSRVENTDASSHAVTHGANFVLLVIDDLGGHSVTGSPQVTFGPTALAAYDGVTDFGGTSGTSGARRTTTGTATGTDLGTLSRFVGTGLVDGKVTASAAGYVTGTPSSVQQIQPDAGVTVTLKYNVVMPRA